MNFITFFYDESEFDKYDCISLGVTINNSNNNPNTIREDISVGNYVVLKYLFQNIYYIGRVFKHESNTREYHIIILFVQNNTILSESYKRGDIIIADAAVLSVAKKIRTANYYKTLSYAIPTENSTYEYMDTTIFLNEIEKERIKRVSSLYTKNKLLRKAEALTLLYNGSNMNEIAKKLNVNKRTIGRWNNNWKKKNTIENGIIKGRPKKLKKEDIEKLLMYIQQHPTQSVKTISKFFYPRISPGSVVNYLQSAGIVRTHTGRSTEEQKKIFHDQLISSSRQYYQQVKSICWNNRVYVNEFCFEISDIRYRICITLKSEKLFSDPLLTIEDHFTNDLFVKYIIEDVIPLLNKGDTLIWDHLGKNGMCSNATNFHYHPQILSSLKGNGINLLYLPPKYNHFNPISMLENYVKHKLVISNNSEKTTMDEVEKTLTDILNSITTDKINEWFGKCADGFNIRKKYPEIFSN